MPGEPGSTSWLEGKSALSPSPLYGVFSSFLGFCCYCHELANLLLVKEASEGCLPMVWWNSKLCPGLLTEVVSVSKEWPALWGELLACYSSTHGPLNCEDVCGVPGRGLDI